MTVDFDPALYTTDDFPRIGCVIAVDITEGGFTIAIYPPYAKPKGGQPVEVYGCRTLSVAGMVMDCLASGRPVPKGYNGRGG